MADAMLTPGFRKGNLSVIQSSDKNEADAIHHQNHSQKQLNDNRNQENAPSPLINEEPGSTQGKVIVAGNLQTNKRARIDVDSGPTTVTARDIVFGKCELSNTDTRRRRDACNPDANLAF
jgi:hypothetical protein